MERKAGGVLHLWRVLLAAGACAGAKAACAAQGHFGAGGRQAAVGKQAGASEPWAREAVSQGFTRALMLSTAAPRVERHRGSLQGIGEESVSTDGVSNLGHTS